MSPTCICAGASLMGLPPSGGFMAKWIYLNVAIDAGQWLWLAVLVVGGLLSAVYIFRVLALAFAEPADAAVREYRPVPPAMQWSGLVLALIAVALGLNTVPPLELLAIGAPVSGPVLVEDLP